MTKAERLNAEALAELGLDGIGLRPSYKRTDFGKLITGPKTNTTILRTDGGIQEKVKQMQNAVQLFHGQVSELAKHLKGRTKEQTAFNIWHFLQPIDKGGQVNYAHDPAGVELFRAPSRLWRDRKAGVDCDCTAIFAACVLKCLGYTDVSFMLVGVKTNRYSHVYVRFGKFSIDPLVRFNETAKGIRKAKEVPI